METEHKMSNNKDFSLARRNALFKGVGMVAASTLVSACGGGNDAGQSASASGVGAKVASEAAAKRSIITVNSCGQAGAGPSCVVRTFNIKSNPVDKHATQEARDLYTWLISKYGKFVISGQTDTSTFDDVKAATGNFPLLRGYDMQHYSPKYSWLWDNDAINPTTGLPGYFSLGADPGERSAENSIAWYKTNGNKPLIAYQWHWHSPSGGAPGTNTFYTDSTTFDASRAVKKGTQEYIDTLRDIDAIAVQLRKLSDAGVPVIWRPLHEAGGTWFWWSAKGPDVYKALWDMIYTRLTSHHKLHNLLWCWCGNDPAWYPGNDSVDIIGIDSYPGDFNYTNNKGEFDKAYDLSSGTKLIAMTENGPIPDVEASLSGGAPWSFFMTWVDVKTGNDDAHLRAVYDDPRVITLERYS